MTNREPDPAEKLIRYPCGHTGWEPFVVSAARSTSPRHRCPTCAAKAKPTRPGAGSLFGPPEPEPAEHQHSLFTKAPRKPS